MHYVSIQSVDSYYDFFKTNDNFCANLVFCLRSCNKTAVFFIVRVSLGHRKFTSQILNKATVTNFFLFEVINSQEICSFWAVNESYVISGSNTSILNRIVSVEPDGIITHKKCLVPYKFFFALYRHR